METYTLNPQDVKTNLPAGMPGTYALGVTTPAGFRTNYVGRSDVDLRRRLMQHALVAAHPEFQATAAETILEAFLAECRDYHLFGQAANMVHPRAPRGLPYTCDYCNIPLEFAELGVLA